MSSTDDHGPQAEKKTRIPVGPKECPLRARVIDELLGLRAPTPKPAPRITMVKTKRGGPGGVSPYARFTQAAS